MQFLIFLSLVAVVASKSAIIDDIIPLEDNTAYGYLTRIGMPLVNNIRDIELLSSRVRKIHKPENPFYRIVEGFVAQLGDIPYQAGILADFHGAQSICGGSLLNARKVITAAHCWWDGENQVQKFTVILGSVKLFTGGTRLQTSNVIVHEDWNPRLIQNDIAMINLPNAVPFSSRGLITAHISLRIGPNIIGLVSPDSVLPLTIYYGLSKSLPITIKMPVTVARGRPRESNPGPDDKQSYSDIISPIALPSGSELKEDFNKDIAVTSGFGLTGDGDSVTPSSSLRHIKLQIITNSQCGQFFKFVHTSNICTVGANGANICRGDSGGPLAVIRNNRHILIGVTSFGSKCSCQDNYPSGFSRISSFINWINRLL